MLLLSLILGGCGGGVFVPVSEQSLDPGSREAPRVTASDAEAKSGDSRPRRYQVATGDTLYSIAWRFGLDYRGVARANDIGPRYRIYPGQWLELREAEAPPSPAATAATGSSSRAQKPPSPPASSAVAGARPSKTPARKEVAATKQAPVSAATKWQWPARGSLISRFNRRGRLNKGVDIAGNPGDPVYAAAAGQVVYAGRGLRGYGNLIIINHDERFLSAYAHNSKLLVQEQQKVSAGEKIAEIGDSDANRTMLHFEIRKDGKPVNPLAYLPKRR